jgi:predicted dehydrogenase
MPRRFYASSVLLRALMEDESLGSLRCYDWEHGVPFGWASASAFWLSRDQAGGGVLIDEGPHLLDCVLDWFGPVGEFDYQDDNWGGVEANAMLTLKHIGRFGTITGRLRMSRTYTLKNRFLLVGNEGMASIVRSEPQNVILKRRLADRDVAMHLTLPGGEVDPFYSQLDDFIESIGQGRQPAVPGCSALPTLELIENCYARRRRLPEPWFDVPSWEAV